MASLCVVELSDEEAESVGVRVGDVNDWGPKIKPLLVAKGFPAESLFLGNTKVRTFRLEGGITQFELLG